MISIHWIIDQPLFARQKVHLSVSFHENLEWVLPGPWVLYHLPDMPAEFQQFLRQSFFQRPKDDANYIRYIDLDSRYFELRPSVCPTKIREKPISIHWWTFWIFSKADRALCGGSGSVARSYLSNAEKPWSFIVFFGGWNPTQLYGDYVINNEINFK